ncbi:unnamed protein product [Schistocephalus solidus]|uniref:Flot domain-containing protein n=1 Tax=Schistocephalus solidus TaxID=70667 RepID=A0A183TEJ1_SCHSO|nr:unnamed protein product [Schistocephalus solidus]
MALMALKKGFHFIAVRTPLDFLSLLNHPGVLHLPQPLLYKAAASKEGCFGSVSPKVHAEEMGIELVERKRRIELEELDCERVKFTLEATVKKPAEAERFRLERIAEAERLRVKAEAEAEAEAITLRGMAEAEASRAVAKAEAEKMRKMAEAMKNYKDAAILDMVLQTLPRIAAEVSAPLAKCQKVTMVSTGEGELGISKISNEVMKVVESLPTLVTSVTGQDMRSLIPAN